MGRANRGGVYIFFAVFHNRSVWAKTRSSLGEEGFLHGFGFDIGHGRVQKPIAFSLFQENPRVRKIRVRNSGAGNGCANFMDTWKNAFFLQEKPCP